MENSDVLGRLENLEILLSANLENMNRIAGSGNKSQDQIKDSTSNSKIDSAINELIIYFKKQKQFFDDFKSSDQKIQNLENILLKMREYQDYNGSSLSKIAFENNQVFQIIKAKEEEKKPPSIAINELLYWILGVVGYIILSVVLCVFLIRGNLNLKAEVNSHYANDMKYRFFKLKEIPVYDIQKSAKNSKDLTDIIDAYYKKNKKEVEEFVLTREDELKRAFEANELARQKIIEAKNAREDAIKLKRQADSLKNK
jgi:hypothetical protein